MLEVNEMMFNNFEPKLKNRFVFYIEGIPAYLIKGAKRPTVTTSEVELDHINVKRKVKGKTVWDNIDITLYDPIVPSGAQAVMEWIRLGHESVTGRDGYSAFYKKDCTIKVLGPVGEVVEEWTLKGAWPVSADFGDLDWASAEPQEIAVSIAMDYAILNF